MKRDLFDLTGQRAIITGGSKGIGRAIAQAYHDYGADIAIIGASEQVYETAKEIASDGGAAVHAIRADLSDRAGIKAMFESCVEKLGGLEILVNNAGINIRTHGLMDYPQEDWDKMFQVNVDTVLDLCRMAANVMLPNGYGRIVNISSISGLRGEANAFCYSATKSAVISLTKSLAMALSPKGINVNSIAPGFVVTDLAKPSLDNPERMKAIYARNATPRVGEPEDLQGAALLLASRACGYITGTTIPVDGGMLERAYQ